MQKSYEHTHTHKGNQSTPPKNGPLSKKESQPQPPRPLSPPSHFYLKTKKQTTPGRSSVPTIVPTPSATFVPRLRARPTSQPASHFGASEGIPSSATGANRAGREGTAAVTDSGASLANDAPLTHTHTRTHARTHEHADETTNTLEHKRPTAAATAPPTPKFRIHNGRAANSPCPTDCTRPKQGRSNSISVLTFLRSFFFFCPAFIPRVFLSSSHVSCNAATDALTLQTIAKKSAALCAPRSHSDSTRKQQQRSPRRFHSSICLLFPFFLTQSLPVSSFSRFSAFFSGAATNVVGSPLSLFSCRANHSTGNAFARNSSDQPRVKKQQKKRPVSA